MILNARNNLFEFKFSKEFVPEVIAQRFRPYLNRMPGNLLKEPIDLINYSIQTVSFPEVQYDPVVQQAMIVPDRHYRNAVHWDDIFSKEVTITMQLMDGYINYWLMFETFRYYYHMSTKEMYIPEGQRLMMFDSAGVSLYTVTYQNMLYNSIGNIELSYSSYAVDFKTFDCGFTYNLLDFNFKIGGNN